MLWRHPEVETVLLRPVNVLGPSVRTLLNRYLGRRRVFTVLGFDPIQQVLHEDDLGLAFEHALVSGVRGVFNVTGPGEVPLHVLIEEAGATAVPLPEAFIDLVKGRLGFPLDPQGCPRVPQVSLHRGRDALPRGLRVRARARSRRDPPRGAPPLRKRTLRSRARPRSIGLAPAGGQRAFTIGA